MVRESGKGGNPMSAPISVAYTNVTQENEFWCWAAVTSNVYNSFLPPQENFLPQGRKFHQCDVAHAVNQSCQAAAVGPFNLENALSARRIKIWEKDDPVLYQNVLDELTGMDPAPVCAEADFGAVKHFVAITGLDPVTHNVWVADPFSGGDAVEFTFDDFVNRYSYEDPQGEVQQSHGVITILYAVFNKFKTS
jgi:hypothetical protein